MRKGRGGIRTHDCLRKRICNPLSPNTNTLSEQGDSDPGQSVLSPSLSETLAKAPELAKIVADLIQAWPNLSAGEQAAIRAMIDNASE